MEDEAPAIEEHETSSSAWRMLGIVILGFVGFNLLTLLLPHDTYARYQQLNDTLHSRTVWAYERIAFDDTPIDVAFIGNSRLNSAVSAPIVERELSERLGRQMRVVNMSLPQEGRNAHFAIAKQLFANKSDVKLVVLSVIEQMPRMSHPAFSKIGEPSDIVSAPVLLNPDYLDDLASVPYQQIALFFRSQFPATFGVESFREENYAGNNLDTFDGRIGLPPKYSTEELRSAARARVASITRPVLPASLLRYEFAVDYHYSDALARLARENGAQVAFLYLPIFENFESLQEAEFYEELGPVLSADCAANYFEFYKDYGHLNREGSELVSEALGEILADAFASDGLQTESIRCE